MTRKLARIVKIDNLLPIEGADRIEVAQIGGWQVVVKKNEFKKGGFAVYFEIDSWIPNSIAPFLTKEGKEPKEFDGVKGERLKTVKLRKVISQGLLIPVSNFAGITQVKEGLDLTEKLGIKKWEPLEDILNNNNGGGKKTGNPARKFPDFIPKTDQDRVQNMVGLYKCVDTFEVTVKLDGSSLTMYCVMPNSNHYCDKRGIIRKFFDKIMGNKPKHNVGVCSRNIELKDNGNQFWETVKQNGNLQAMIDYCVEHNTSVAVQGELVAPNIQGNYEKVDKAEFYCFNVFHIDEGIYLLPEHQRKFCKETNISYVPMVASAFNLPKEYTIKSLLDMAEGSSMNKGVKREGLVFKSNQRDFSFKAISNSYLLHKESKFNE